jgi:hypothetical protein
MLLLPSLFGCAHGYAPCVCPAVSCKLCTCYSMQSVRRGALSTGVQIATVADIIRGLLDRQEFEPCVSRLFAHLWARVKERAAHALSEHVAAGHDAANAPSADARTAASAAVEWVERALAVVLHLSAPADGQTDAESSAAAPQVLERTSITISGLALAVPRTQWCPHCCMSQATLRTAPGAAERKPTRARE